MHACTCLCVLLLFKKYIYIYFIFLHCCSFFNMSSLSLPRRSRTHHGGAYCNVCSLQRSQSHRVYMYICGVCIQSLQHDIPSYGGHDACTSLMIVVDLCVNSIIFVFQNSCPFPFPLVFSFIPCHFFSLLILSFSPCQH